MSSGRPLSYRPPLRRGVKLLLAVNLAIFLVELAVAYALGFNQARMDGIIRWVGLSLDGIARVRLWQPISYMWIHDPDQIFHLGFNLIVLYFFGPTIEQMLGTARFLRHFVAYGLGGGLLYLVSALLAYWLFGHPLGIAIGASGAIAGVVMGYCLMYWRQTLFFFFFRLSGRSLLIAFLVIDLIRLLSGEAIAVQAHWGGMLTALLLLRWNPPAWKLWWLRFKRRLFRRRFRVISRDESPSEGRWLN
ncbi:MAG: rhomboid family intramembrane serine protease [Bradymonadales bacterium]|nr:rhomboid family intramembrane serine protease [Bradymonadales bacterium]